MRFSCHLFTVALAFVSASTALPAANFDFEGFNDLDPANTIYQASGLTINGGSVLLSGFSLNEFEFPPASGTGVFASVDGQGTVSPVLLDFSTPITSFSAYFTYGGPLTLNFYAQGGPLITTVLSQFQANLGFSGDPGSTPNEFLGEAALALPAVQVEIIAGTASFISDFTMDDITVEFQQGGPTPVPEPAAWQLLGLGLLVIAVPRLLTRS